MSGGITSPDDNVKPAVVADYHRINATEAAVREAIKKAWRDSGAEKARQSLLYDHELQTLAQYAVSALGAMKTEDDGEAEGEIELLNKLVIGLNTKLVLAETALSTTIFTVIEIIGGTVDGLPTQSINYLQRLRELLAVERSYEELRRLELLRPAGAYGLSSKRNCDCCNKAFPRDQVSHCWVTGIETFACDACRGIAKVTVS